MSDISETIIDAAGVPRWKSNGQVPFDDMLEAWIAQGHPVNLEASRKARAESLREFMAGYRAAQARRSAEQIAEERAMARAAHGPGVEMVNILTGERYRT